MSRARREKKNHLKIWVPIVCVVVVAITFFMIHDIQKKIDKMEPQNTLGTLDNTSQNEVTDVENEVSENLVEENVVENENSNSTENATSSKNQVINQTINESSKPTQPGVTDQKQKAIELVKKEWGEDDTVNYVFDYVNENGEYVIAVKDRNTATVKYYFRVNLETKTVELD